MKFESPLISAKLVKRYKRFLADAILDNGEEITAHCPNTGSMKTCGQPGDQIYLSHHPSPKRKLPYTWELTKTKGGMICINTNRPNKVVEDAITKQAIPELTGYASLRREVRYGDKSRIDILLEDPQRGRCWIEIKSVTLLDGQDLLFPDAVTSRGLKHIKELQMKKSEGDRSVLFLLVNRPEGTTFKPAFHIDPDWAAGLIEAHQDGVEILAYRNKCTTTEMNIDQKIPVHLHHQII